ncbi:MAG: YebC/PmpR family DNA-binding transcriptional regulator [Acidobacteriota bacterium]|nr:MAG: YebC/PmpR family DNA-binding transcriptional regulator [Acidobacteriota bacterium]
MAGHSKWANIKHRKSAQDARRAKVFTKIAREIIVAAREGGGDPAGNPRLRSAVAAARAANMPGDRVEKAIKKGTGDVNGVQFESVLYEGYGPNGVAIFVTALTDNRNRTTAEVRHLFSKYGGDLGAPGSVAWMFERKGYIEIPRADVDEEALLEQVLESGGEDMRTEDDHFEIVTTPEVFPDVRDTLERAGFPMTTAEVTMVPQTYVEIAAGDADGVIALLEGLEDHDDVQKVSANCEIMDAATS